MIYTIGGLQEKSGKTTIAINLAIWLSKMTPGSKVLLIDTDTQAKALHFTRKRSRLLKSRAGYTLASVHDDSVRSLVDGVKSRYDHIVIDMIWGDSRSHRRSLLISDIYIIPLRISWFHTWSGAQLQAMIDAEAPFRSVALRIFSFENTVDEKDEFDKSINLRFWELNKMVEMLPPLDRSTSFRQAFEAGLSIFEMPQKDERACTQLHLLFLAVANA